MFKVKKELHQTIIQSYWEEFDTDDQDQWESLKSRVEEAGAEGIEDYPNQAPSDPSIWFELYQMLDHSDYENCDEDDWVSDREGTTESNFELEDESGDVIDSA